MSLDTNASFQNHSRKGPMLFTCIVKTAAPMLSNVITFYLSRLLPLMVTNAQLETVHGLFPEMHNA